jgi:hypothetical protein
MVRIGFLSRVRVFTYRDDLHSFITSSSQWKAKPFHFRLYFDMLSAGAKGKTAYVLMIAVDHPNTEAAMSFFQQWYNGDGTNSPNDIAHLFFPLFKKTYIDEEQYNIIIDHEHHIGTSSVVAVRGLQALDSLVQLATGVCTTIQRLLLSILAQGTSTGKLFTQVERQSYHDWLLCCFPTMDAPQVTIRLGQLEDSLRQYIHQDSLPKLFQHGQSLSFSGQVAPLTKGKLRFPRLESTPETDAYASRSFGKLYTPTPKRIALTPPEETGVVTPPLPVAVPTQSRIPWSATTPQVPTHSHISYSSLEQVVQKLQLKASAHDNSFQKLETCRSSLAATTSQLVDQMAAMNSNFNSKFVHLATSIDGLHTSPNRRLTKQHKDHHGLPDIRLSGEHDTSY